MTGGGDVKDGWPFDVTTLYHQLRKKCGRYM
jgi:hypothetical protein